MLLRRLFAFMLLAIAAALTWRYTNSEFVHGLMHPESRRPRPIVFDNGSVRDEEMRFDPRSDDLGKTTPLIGLRKCVRGAKVSYTDQPCPAGTREESVGKGTVTVIEGGRSAHLAPAKEPQQRRKTIRDVMDVDSTELRRQLMERAIGN